MQEDVENKSVSLAIKGVKLTGNLLKWAMRKFLAALKENKVSKDHEIPHGKQSVKKLVGQNQGVSNIEITDKNIKSFESVARKYGVDFAVKKVAPQAGEKVPTFHVFFKARDADALQSAFKEYSGKRMKKEKRPSALGELQKMKAKAKSSTLDRAKHKAKEVAR